MAVFGQEAVSFKHVFFPSPLGIRLPNWPHYWYMYMSIYIYIIYTFQLSTVSTIKLEHVGICFGPRTSTERTKSHPNPSGILQVLRVVAHLRSRSRNHLFQRIQLLSIANKAVFRPVVWVGRTRKAISWSHLDLDFYVKNGIIKHIFALHPLKFNIWGCNI